MSLCATCGVEHAEPAGVCAICADERQWVPADGQRWVTLDELTRAGCRTRVEEPEPGLLEISVEPRITRGAEALGFDRLYDNFGHVIERDAAGAVRRSADRYRSWVSGAFDHLT